MIRGPLRTRFARVATARSNEAVNQGATHAAGRGDTQETPRGTASYVTWKSLRGLITSGNVAMIIGDRPRLNSTTSLLVPASNFPSSDCWVKVIIYYRRARCYENVALRQSNDLELETTRLQLSEHRVPNSVSVETF